MIFKHVCIKGDKYLAKIIFKEGDGEKWATTSKAVFEWAKNNFKDGDTVDVEYEVKNGQYFVSRISASGSSAKASQKTKSTKTEETSVHKCEDCSATLKDGKYKKCYTCNQKNPKESSPEKAEAIARQNANHATSRALISLQGQIDINNIYEISEQLHKHFLRLAKGK